MRILLTNDDGINAPGLYVLRASDGQNTFTKRFAKQ